MKLTVSSPTNREFGIVSSLYVFFLVSQLSLAEDNENLFVNWHTSIDVGGKVQSTYRPRNNVVGSEDVQSIDFLGGLQTLKDILSQVPEGRRIRAYGSKWSMSNISFVSDTLIETWGLNYCKIGIENPSHVSLQYQEKSDKLVFVQTGVMVKHLNTLLEASGLSISTTGGSDGQRLVGAISTGTHGSAPLYGAMTEFVRGIHVVTSGTDHFYIQRETDPAVTPAYSNEFLNGATLVESNDLFEAVLVGLGSFGIIHAVLIEVEPLYVLKTQYKVLKYEDIKINLASLDVGSFGFDGITDVPHFFQLSINPYDLQNVHVAAAEKFPPNTTGSTQKFDPRIFQNETLIEDPIMAMLHVARNEMTWLRYADAGSSFRGTFRSMGNAIKRIVFSKALKLGLRTYFGNLAKNSMKSHGTLFQQPGSDNDSQPSPFPSTEMEIAVPVERVTEVLDIWIEILKRRPILQSLNVRYVKGSNATLAFTRFNVTATISLFGIWSNALFRDVEDVYFEIMETMAASTIPHCWHWGKKQPSTSSWIVNSCYGVARRDAWIHQRETFLPDTATRNMFSSDALEFLGLHT